MTDFYWEGLFEVIERALSPRRGKDFRPTAPPSKRITKRKTKGPTRKRKSKSAKVTAQRKPRKTRSRASS